MISAAARFRRFILLGGFVLAVILLSSSATASSDSTWFTRVWQSDDGLLDNNIDQVVQGADDYLWLVTPVGMMQFDGNSFRPFRMEDFVASADCHVRKILCSRTGALWMASDGGAIIRLDRNFFATTAISSKSSRILPWSVPNAWDEGGDGALWIGYSNAVYRMQNDVVMKLTANERVPSGSFHTLHGDGVGDIWLAKGTQLGFFKDGTFCSTKIMPGVRCIGATHTNAVWFVADGHLFRSDTRGQLRDCGAFQNPMAATTTALLEDHTEAVWIATDGNGLFRYNGSGFERIETSHASVLSLAEDREGNIWAGTGGCGLDRITFRGVRLEAMENDQMPSQIQSICEDADGILWGATQNGALVSRVNGRWMPVLTNAPFAGIATCVAAGDGGVWVGTQKGKLFCLGSGLDAARETYLAAMAGVQRMTAWAGDTNYTIWEVNLADFPILGLLPASNGDLWIAGDKVLQCLHRGQIKNIKLPRDIRYYAIAEDAGGKIWIGGGDAFMYFDGKKLVDRTPHLKLSGRPICCIYATDDGYIWIGSRGGGLIRYKNAHAEQVGSNQGLADDYISQIVEDRRGWLWFGANHGIFKIRKEELDLAMKNRNIHLRPIIYGENEGLASLEALYSVTAPYIFSRAILDRDGRVWLLTHKGVVVAAPAVLSDDLAPPPVLLTQVVLDGQATASYGGAVSFKTVANLKSLSDPLQLPPSHRHLEFDFTAFHLRAPENTHFRYQLVGFDTNWIDAGTERTANYSRLSAGHYRFDVEACVGAGQWSDPAILSVTVIPFFWQTWWFQVGVFVLFTSCVIVAARYISIRKIKVQMGLLEQRAALDKERARIARDLHDDLGCSLNKVALTLDMMRSDSAGPDSESKDIRQCSVMVRDIAQSMDEIVWAINPRNDTLRYMVDYISQSAVEFLQAAGLRCVVDLPENLPDQTVPPDARHNLLLVVKEALNNIARHARATEVHLCISVSESQIAIGVMDNGCGFESAPDNSECDGLRNMRQRMEEIHGEFQLKSQPGNGTRVAFHYAWPSKTRG